MILDQIVRKNILHLKPYSSARDEYSGKEGIFLDANENAFGSVVNELLNRYPDPVHQKLKNRIAEIKTVSTNQIFLGNGSDEAIDLIIRATCEPGLESLIILPPTYGMYEVCAAVNNVAVRRIVLTPDFQINVDEILREADAKCKLLFICSPNNPTGNCFPPWQIETLLRNFSGLVILDEAYIDFSPEKSWLPRLNEFENLVILQTFSKAWGLANIRLGMAFADPEIISILNNIKYPYNVNGVTQQIALTALENMDLKNEMVEKILRQRNDLQNQLNRFDFVEKIYPSDANFLLIKVQNTKQVFDYLLSKKIIVRNRSNVVLCEGCLRITVGTPEENRVLIAVLQSYSSNI